MTTEKLHYDVVEHTAEAFVAEVVARTLDGWAISPTNPGDLLITGTLTVSMFRDDTTLQAARNKMSNIAEKPKMSREETLAVARAARASKAATPRLDIDTVQ